MNTEIDLEMDQPDEMLPGELDSSETLLPEEVDSAPDIQESTDQDIIEPNPERELAAAEEDFNPEELSSLTDEVLGAPEGVTEEALSSLTDEVIGATDAEPTEEEQTQLATQAKEITNYVENSRSRGFQIADLLSTPGVVSTIGAKNVQRTVDLGEKLEAVTKYGSTKVPKGDDYDKGFLSRIGGAFAYALPTAAAKITEAPQFLVDFSREMAIAFDEFTGLDQVYDAVGLPNSRESAVGFSFRNNPVARQLKDWAGDIPESAQRGIINSYNEEGVLGAAEAAVVSATIMAGDLLATVAITRGTGAVMRGAGLGAKAFGATTAAGVLQSTAPTVASSLPKVFGLMAADQARQNQLAMGRPEVGDTRGVFTAAGQGILAYALSQQVIINRVQSYVGVVNKNYGSMAAGEFAKESTKYLLKATAFDSMLNGGQAGAEMLLNYVSGVDEKALDSFWGNMLEATLTSVPFTGALGAGTMTAQTYRRFKQIKYHNKHLKNVGDSLDALRSNMKEVQAGDTEGSKVLRETRVGIVKSSGMFPDGVAYVDQSSLLKALGPEGFKRFMDENYPPEFSDSKADLAVSVEKLLDIMETLEDDGSYNTLRDSLKVDPEMATIAKAQEFNKSYDKVVEGYLNPALEKTESGVRKVVKSTVDKVKDLFTSKETKAMQESERAKAMAMDAPTAETQKLVDDTFKPLRMDSDGPVPVDMTLPVLAPSERLSFVLGDKAIATLADSVKATETFRKYMNALVDSYGVREGEVVEGVTQVDFTTGEKKPYSPDSSTGYRTDLIDQNARLSLESDPATQLLHIAAFGETVQGKPLPTTATGEPMRISLADARSLYGDKVARSLAKRYPKMFAKKGETGAKVGELMDFLGIEDPQEILGILNSQEGKRVRRYKTGKEALDARVQGIVDEAVSAMDAHKRMQSGESSLQIDNMILKGVFGEELSTILHPEMGKLMEAEVKALKTQLQKEFQGKESKLLKNIPNTRERKARAKQGLLDMDYRAVEPKVFVKAALAAEKRASILAAQAMRKRNLVEAYEHRADALFARSMSEAATELSIAKKRADRVFDTARKGVEQQVAEGYDVDFMDMAIFAMDRQGLTTRHSIGRVNSALERLRILKELDPMKYDQMDESMSGYMLRHPERASTLGEYLELATKIDDLMKEGQEYNLIERQGKKETIRAVGDSVVDQLLEKIILREEKRDSTFKVRLEAHIQKHVNELVSATGEKISKVQMSDLRRKLAIEYVRLDQANAELNKGVVGTTLDTVSDLNASARTATDFFHELGVKELLDLAEGIRGAETQFLTKLNTDVAGWLNSLVDFMNNSDVKLHKKKVKIGDYTIRGTKDILGLLLHAGNEQNFKRVAQSNFGMKPEDLKLHLKRLIDDGTITKSHIEFVQKFWDMYGSYRPDLQRHHKRTRGYFFKEVKAGFTLGDIVPTEWGQFKGGYAPLKLDFNRTNWKNLSHKVEGHDVKNLLEREFDMEGMYMQEERSNTVKGPDGMTRSRTPGANGMLELDVTMYDKHLNKVLALVHMENPVKDMAKVILSHPQVTDALTAYNPSAVNSIVMPYLKNTVMQSFFSAHMGNERFTLTSSALEKTMYQLMGRSGTVILAGNPLTPFLNAGELGKTVDALYSAYKKPGTTVDVMAGVKAVGVTSAAFARSFVPSVARKISQESAFMAERHATAYGLAVRDFTNTIGAASKFTKVSDRADVQWRFVDRLTQRISDNASYIVFKNEGKRQGMSDVDAVKYAERMVERTMPGYRMSQQSALMGSPYGRFFNRFATWAIKAMNYNVTRKNEIQQRVLREGFKAYGEYLPAAMFLMILPAMYEDAIRKAAYGQDIVDEDLWDENPTAATAAFALNSTIARGGSMIPVVGGYAEKQARKFVADRFKGTEYEDFTGTLVSNRWGFESGPFSIPEERVVKNLKAVGEAADLIFRQQEPERGYGDVMHDLLYLAGFATRSPLLGSPMVRKPVKYLLNQYDGMDEEPENVRQLLTIMTRGTTEQE